MNDNLMTFPIGAGCYIKIQNNLMEMRLLFIQMKSPAAASNKNPMHYQKKVLGAGSTRQNFGSHRSWNFDAGMTRLVLFFYSIESSMRHNSRPLGSDKKRTAKQTNKGGANAEPYPPRGCRGILPRKKKTAKQTNYGGVGGGAPTKKHCGANQRGQQRAMGLGKLLPEPRGCRGKDPPAKKHCEANQRGSGFFQAVKPTELTLRPRRHPIFYITLVIVSTKMPAAGVPKKNAWTITNVM